MCSSLTSTFCLQYRVFISSKRFVYPVIEKTIMFSPRARLLNAPSKWLNYPTMGLSTPQTTLDHFTTGLHIPHKRLNYPTFGALYTSKEA